MPTNAIITNMSSVVDEILSDAIRKNASDIHFEQFEHYLRVRYRIDGLLHEISSHRIGQAESVVAKLKIMSNLDISERRLPQDGRFTIELKNQLLRNCRISTCPTLHGEKVVIRILNDNASVLSLDQLGLEPEQLTLVQSNIRHHGLIIFTGPTGSGKSVSLYALLNELYTVHQNISTIEDPIEIQMPGINQVNINNKIGLTFATCLRAFLRQDPDIIMIGEIRDSETAEIAVRAAQTGHLVLSTLHTNNAAQSITRLLNMGVSPYNLSSALNLVVAQRLVRTLCRHCNQHRFSEPSAPPSETQQTCKYCFNGYSGRTGIFEVLKISAPIKQMISTNYNSLHLDSIIHNNGMLTLRQAANIKLAQSITTLEEVNRVL